MRQLAPGIESFSLEQAEETISGCLVGTVANPAHVADQFVENQLMVRVREMRTSIRMHDDRLVSRRFSWVP